MNDDNEIKKEGGCPKYWIGERLEKAQDYILKRMMEGYGLRRILKMKDDPDRPEVMPVRRTITEWILNNENGFQPRYVNAKKIMCAEKFEMLEDEADELIEKVIDGKANSLLISAIKHKSDIVRWTLSKLVPRKYGQNFNINTEDEKDIDKIEICFNKLAKHKENANEI